jgi:hypothetical protein
MASSGRNSLLRGAICEEIKKFARIRETCADCPLGRVDVFVAKVLGLPITNCIAIQTVSNLSILFLI